MIRLSYLYFLLILALPSAEGQDLSLHKKEKMVNQAMAYEAFSEVFSETDLDSCRHYTELALDLYKQAKDWEGYSTMFSGLAGISYLEDDYEMALHYNQQAIAIANQYLGKNSQSLAHALNTRGVLLEVKGQYAAATRNWKRSLELIKLNGGEEEYLAASLINLSYGYLKNGDHNEAITYLKQTEQIYKKSNDPYLVQVYTSLSKNYKELQQYEQALAFNQKAQKTLATFPENVFSIDQRLGILLTRADIYRIQGQYDQARSMLAQAKQLCPPDFLKQRARVYEGYGDLYVKEKKYKLALDNFAQCGRLIAQLYPQENHPRFAINWRKKAEVYEQQGNHEAAIAHYQEALLSLSAEFAKKDYRKNPSLDDLLSLRDGFPIFRQKGQALLHAYAQNKNPDYLSAAFDTYQHLAQLIVKIRQSFESEESRRFLLANAHEVYEEAIEIALALHANTQAPPYLDAAFVFAESNKSILLLDALHHHQAFGLGGLPDSLLNQESKLRTSIAFYERSILESKNKQKNTGNQIGVETENQQETTQIKIQLWEKQLLNIRQKYQNLVTQIEQDYPHFYQLKYQQGATSIAAIQKRLPDEQSLLLEYFLGSTEVYLFVLHKNHAEVITIPNKENLVQQIHKIRQIISQRPLSENYTRGFEDFQNLSHSLYQQLIQPAISPAQSINKLIIVPDGELNYLPFEVLTHAGGASPTPSYRALFQQALVHQYVLSYAYSASLLFAPTRTSTAATGAPSFLGFAPSFGQEIAVDRSCQADQLHSLECNQAEVENIQRLFSGQSFYGLAANRENFKTHFSEATIIHLATHACVDEEQGNFNRIFFADGDLSNFEIKNLSLNTDLVTLSACNTGVGKLLKGEGLMSLAKSFAIAGCPSTLMSIWSVDDCATSDIMLSFYEQIRAGKNKDQALQFSKNQYLQKADKLHAHPYYWAAFIQMGNTEPLYVPKSSRYLWLFGVLGITLLIGFFFKKTIPRLTRNQTVNGFNDC